MIDSSLDIPRVGTPTLELGSSFGLFPKSFRDVLLKQSFL